MAEVDWHWPVLLRHFRPVAFSKFLRGVVELVVPANVQLEVMSAEILVLKVIRAGKPGILLNS